MPWRRCLLPFLSEISFFLSSIVLMPCCIGVRPVNGLAATGTLWPFFLLFFSFVQPCISVCIHCKDTILPAHESAACPLELDMAANADIFSTGTLGSIPKVNNLLPLSISRIFPKAAMEAMVSIATAPANGGQIDFSNAQYATSSSVVKAALYGHCTHEEAGCELQTRLDGADGRLRPRTVSILLICELTNFLRRGGSSQSRSRRRGRRCTTCPWGKRTSVPV